MQGGVMNWIYLRHVRDGAEGKVAALYRGRRIGVLVGLRGPDGHQVNSVDQAVRILEALDAAQVPTGLWTAPAPRSTDWADDLACLAPMRPALVVLDPEVEWKHASGDAAAKACEQARGVIPPTAELGVAVYPLLPHQWPWRSWGAADFVSPMSYEAAKMVSSPVAADQWFRRVVGRMTEVYPGKEVRPSVPVWGLSREELHHHLEQARLVWPKPTPFLGWGTVEPLLSDIEELANG
jgi:hypothetical protein